MLLQAVLPFIPGLQQICVGDRQLLAKLQGSEASHNNSAFRCEEVCRAWAAAVIDVAGVPERQHAQGPTSKTAIPGQPVMVTELTVHFHCIDTAESDTIPN